MAGLLESCERYFSTTDLYRVLGVRKEAGDGEIRRGYHRVSLQVHPDRVQHEDKETATIKFQILSKVYTVLSDKEQRALYNEQGIVDEETDTLSQDRNWEEYWRLLFKKITVEDIKAYEEKYKGSEDENKDIKQAYLDFEGDMESIMESVPCASFEDEPRIRQIIQKAIKAKEIPSYDAFVKEPKKKREQRKKRAHEEAKEAEEMREEMGLGEGKADLKAMIERRQNDRKKGMDSFFDQLEAKYCSNSKKGGSKAKAPKKGNK
ncbi:hypothetical protein GDO86_013205 [Hymenochirus boettgeri]|uniref:DnaJ homolog subfamily C member 9 n=1 Tax=Hymenochirus boettgeri TaxID=247094 RepID=A0A8T2IQE5_9PIPI|nr:hypothetical protein GDO86_013205 [Hymenochirus boettgeri]